MVWSRSADDRAFLRQLSREIVAAVVPSELDTFDTWLNHYFADPTPPRLALRCPPELGAQGRTLISSAVPAVISTLLNLLALEVEEAGNFGQPDVVRQGLKRLLRSPAPSTQERIWLPPARRSEQRLLKLTLLIYTQPVTIALALTRLADVAYEAAQLYGLDEAEADELVPAAIARLSLGTGVA